MAVGDYPSKRRKPKAISDFDPDGQNPHLEVLFWREYLATEELEQSVKVSFARHRDIEDEEIILHYMDVGYSLLRAFPTVEDRMARHIDRETAVGNALFPAAMNRLLSEIVSGAVEEDRARKLAQAIKDISNARPEQLVDLSEAEDRSVLVAPPPTTMRAVDGGKE